MIFLGYDPGGADANGVALLRSDGNRSLVQVATLDSVESVIGWFRDRVGDHIPRGAGIDTLLTWSPGPSGWRPMDHLLRQRYPAARSSVMASNSIYGSMCVQGMAAAMLLRQVWPELRLNETHPKVLYYTLSGQLHDFGPGMVDWLMHQIGPGDLATPITNEHEWDALISAWATWQGCIGNWASDLMMAGGQAQRLLTPAGPVTYYWPE